MPRLLAPALACCLLLVPTREARGQTADACSVPARSGQTPAQRAVACAEAFVRDNGYTDTPALADTTRLVPESIEWTGGWAARLDFRRGQLAPRAVAVCPWITGSRTPGFTVVFARRAPAPGARAVVMLADYTLLEVEHQDLDPAALWDPEYRCTRL